MLALSPKLPSLSVLVGREAAFGSKNKVPKLSSTFASSLVDDYLSATPKAGGRGDRRQLVMWSDTTMALAPGGRTITVPHTGQVTDNIGR
jgi:hypothetical protein